MSDGFCLASRKDEPGWRKSGMTCLQKACRHAWLADTPTHVPLNAWAGFVGALRCPACGSRKIAFGYTPTPAQSIQEMAHDRPAMTDRERFARWMNAGDTGLSSETIARVMAGTAVQRPDHPHDAADLGRCLRLLRRFPGWRGRMDEVAALSPQWRALVAVWSDLAAAMEREVGLNWEKGSDAVVTAGIMRQALCRADAPASRPARNRQKSEVSDA